MKEIIQKLRAFDLNDEFKNQEIRTLLLQLTMPIVPAKIEKENVIIRLRRGWGYKEEKDMSYKPMQLCDKYQRASLLNQPVFYGVLSDDQEHLENATAIGIGECSLLVNQGENSIGRENITSSQWRLKQDIRVACIICNDSYRVVDNNKLLEIIQQASKTFDNTIELLDTISFVEREFTKKVFNEKDYKISATIADILLNEYNYEALAYPSVKFNGQIGLNLAIRPDVVDSKLELFRILELCYYKNAAKGIFRIESYYNIEKRYKQKVCHFPTFMLCNKIGIDTIEELPIVK